jgi:hypothetical protein
MTDHEESGDRGQRPQGRTVFYHPEKQTVVEVWDIGGAHEALARAADELPEGVPGRTAVQDALRTLEEADDG